VAWAFLDDDVPHGFAHRGGDEVATENTIAAFQHAMDLGYRYLETDVHVTRDGVLVAFHDSDLQRVAGLVGTIEDHDWASLGSVDLGGGSTIPTMDELLVTFPDARFNIDPKTDAAVAPLAAVLEANDAVGRVCIGSFSDERIDALRQRLGRELCTSPGPRALVQLMAQSWWPRVRGTGIDHGAVQIPVRFGPVVLTKRQVDRFHDLGLQVHVWTINDENDMRRLLDLGVDAVMTDKTTVLKRVMVERGEWT
jgi:glycerophosphoryl diester phosphodiesterase